MFLTNHHPPVSQSPKQENTEHTRQPLPADGLLKILDRLDCLPSDPPHQVQPKYGYILRSHKSSVLVAASGGATGPAGIISPAVLGPAYGRETEGLYYWRKRADLVGRIWIGQEAMLRIGFLTRLSQQRSEVLWPSSHSSMTTIHAAQPSSTAHIRDLEHPTPPPCTIQSDTRIWSPRHGTTTVDMYILAQTELGFCGGHWRIDNATWAWDIGNGMLGQEHWDIGTLALA